VINDSVEEIGLMAITNGGDIIIQRDAIGTDFTTTNDNGFVTPPAYWTV
jgi:hypothetical protein